MLSIRNCKFVTFLTIMSLCLAFLLPMFATAAEVDFVQYHEVIWYDSDGNVIIDDEQIDKLQSIQNTSSRAVVCCSNQDPVTYYFEEHFYEPPVPAWCTYNRYREIFCNNCNMRISETLIGTYSHVHQ